MKATLTLADAADRLWDVAVVGAGPAGALAARALAQRGCGVLLLDKSAFPRGKVCGGCINHRTQYALASAGLGNLLTDLGAANVDGLTLAAGARTASIPIPGYFGITRETLDNALVTEAVNTGAAFLPKSRAVSTRAEAETRVIGVSQYDSTVEIRARIVVAAGGLGSGFAHDSQDVAPASRIGAGIILDDAPEYYQIGQIYMACAAGGYVGLTRVEDGRIDIAAAFDPPYIRAKGGLGPAAAGVFEEAGFAVWPAFSEGAWRGTPALTRTNTEVTAERMYVIGDAAGYVEPFTGEGIAWAATTALAVAPIVADAVDCPTQALERAWKQQYRQIVTRRQYLCYALAHALRRPSLMKTAIRLLSRMPQLARPIVTSVNATVRI